MLFSYSDFGMHTCIPGASPSKSPVRLTHNLPQTLFWEASLVIVVPVALASEGQEVFTCAGQNFVEVFKAS